MLQRAAAADSEMRALRRHALRRRDENVHQGRLVQMPAPLEQAIADSLPRQSAVDEYGLAVDSCDAAAVVGKIHDVGFLHRRGLQAAGHDAANSLRCAAAESSSSLRTRAISWACSAAFRRPRSSSKRKKIK